MKPQIRSALFLLFYMFISIILFNECTDRAISEQFWYKGNLHTHSYWSDGNEFPEMVMEWYKSNGYNFIALSDHNVLAEGDYWESIPDKPHNREAFDNYLERFGEEWVNYREDSGRLEVKLKTFAEYKPLFEVQDRFLILQSEEITDRFEDREPEVNATNIQELIPPRGGESVIEVLQNNINAVLEQREETGVPMIVHVNHPNAVFISLTAEDIAELTGVRFLEVYNGYPAARNMGDSLHASVEEMWDLVNIAYLQKGQPLIYGLGVDDTHHYHRTGSRWGNAGRGWIVVRASELTAESLIESMEMGQFYASTGVSLNDVTYENRTLKVIVDAEPGIDYRIVFIGCNPGDEFTRILEEVIGPEAEFEVEEDLSFVRAKVISSKLKENPNYMGEFEVAWIQPVTNY